MLLAVIENRKW